MIRLPTGEKQGVNTKVLIKRLPSKQDGTVRKDSCEKGSFFVTKLKKYGRKQTARIKT